jgi:hypothetical protein
MPLEAFDAAPVDAAEDAGILADAAYPEPADAAEAPEATEEIATDDQATITADLGPEAGGETPQGAEEIAAEEEPAAIASDPDPEAGGEGPEATEEIAADDQVTMTADLGSEAGGEAPEATEEIAAEEELAAITANPDQEAGGETPEATEEIATDEQPTIAADLGHAARDESPEPADEAESQEVAEAAAPGEQTVITVDLDPDSAEGQVSADESAADEAGGDAGAEPAPEASEVPEAAPSAAEALVGEAADPAAMTSTPALSEENTVALTQDDIRAAMESSGPVRPIRPAQPIQPLMAPQEQPSMLKVRRGAEMTENLTKEEVAAWAQDGRLKAEHLVAHQFSENWLEASKVPFLRPIFVRQKPQKRGLFEGLFGRKN